MLFYGYVGSLHLNSHTFEVHSGQYKYVKKKRMHVFTKRVAFTYGLLIKQENRVECFCNGMGAKKEMEIL